MSFDGGLKSRSGLCRNSSTSSAELETAVRKKQGKEAVKYMLDILGLINSQNLLANLQWVESDKLNCLKHGKV